MFSNNLHIKSNFITLNFNLFVIHIFYITSRPNNNQLYFQLKLFLSSSYMLYYLSLFQKTFTRIWIPICCVNIDFNVTNIN